MRQILTSLKQRVLKLLNFPRYGPVGLHDPQQQVAVWLHGLGEPLDVTHNNVVVALRPFTIGVMFNRPDLQIGNDQSLRLCMHEGSRSNRLLGVIQLRLVQSILIPEHRFCLFECKGCENYCVPAFSLRLYYLNEGWRAWIRRRTNPYNFQMTPTDLQCNYVFYICPRPVVLVTVEYEDLSNIFPMDLIGPTDSPWYTMALRSTSPAVRLMQQSGHMALASVPFTYKPVVYEMGKHHKLTSIDWSALPFRTVRSPLFGLRVPEAALRLREVIVKEYHVVGSHVLFITSIARETVPESLPEGADGLQLFHSFGSCR